MTLPRPAFLLMAALLTGAPSPSFGDPATVAQDPGVVRAGPSGRQEWYDNGTAKIPEGAEIFRTGYGSYVMFWRGSFDNESAETCPFTVRGLVSPILVNGKTYFLGAGHVFDLNQLLLVRGYSLQQVRNLQMRYEIEYQGLPCALRRVDDGKRDMALFVAADGAVNPPFAPFACGDSDEVRAGNAVLAWGMPLMEGFELSTGIISALSAPPSLLAAGFPGAAADDFFVTSMPGVFGSSGALVYALRSGEPEIVGMLVAGYVNMNRSLVYKVNAILRDSGLR